MSASHKRVLNGLADFFISIKLPLVNARELSIDVNPMRDTYALFISCAR